MRKIVTAAVLAGGFVLGGVAHAQTLPAATDGSAVSTAVTASTGSDAGDVPVGKAAGTFMVRLRAIGLMPLVSSSSVSVIGGHVDVTNQVAPEVDLSYFFTDHIAVEGIAATTRHEVAVIDSSLGHVDVGSVWVLPPTVTLQYHFMPQSRFSPYLGAGMTVAFFYASEPAKPIVQSVGFSNSVGAAIQAGFDYNVSGHWFLNFDVKQIFLSTEARLNGGAIVAKTALNPLVIGAGVGYRF